MRTYSIEELLVDQYYAPQSLKRRFNGGIINFAEKREDSVWVGENYECYVVRYTPKGSTKDQWATVAVKVSDF